MRPSVWALAGFQDQACPQLRFPLRKKAVNQTKPVVGSGYYLGTAPTQQQSVICKRSNINRYMYTHTHTSSYSIIRRILSGGSTQGITDELDGSLKKFQRFQRAVSEALCS